MIYDFYLKFLQLKFSKKNIIAAELINFIYYICAN